VLPIEIEFPVAPSVDYAFARPLLGRSGAEIRFRTVTAGQAMFVELGLSALALVLLLLVKLRRPAAAANAAAGLFVISLALLLLVPGPAATMFAATALATGICFAAEAIHQIIIRIREPQPKEV